MSKILLYHSPYSPFSRSVLLLSRFLNLDIEVKVLNLLDDEQLEPEFLELNPQHCVPTLDDNGFIIWESRAVLAYLLESKAPQLVPTSPKEKAIVNQRLYYEMGKLAKTYAALWAPLFEGGNELESKTIEEIREVLRFVDEHYFPHGNEWIASANITIADFAFVSVIAGLTAAGAPLEKYPRIKLWFDRCKSTFPGFDELEEGAKLFGDWVAAHAINTLKE